MVAGVPPRSTVDVLGGRRSSIHRRATPQRSIVAVPRRAAGAAGRLIGAALDGLIIGLTLGFIALTALSGPGAYLGVPWPAEVVLVGDAVALAALVGAGVAVVVTGLIAWLGHGLDRLFTRGPRLVRRAVRVPFSLIEGLPAAWLGAFAVLLWVGIAGHAIGPLGLLAPAGALSPYVYVIGVVGALLGAARAILGPATWRHSSGTGLVRHVSAVAVVVVAVALVAAASSLALAPGSTAALVAPDPAFDGDPAATDLADPGLPGPYAVRTMSYGSGRDGRRPAFGAEATFMTPTVDASAALPPLGNGADETREWFWGFGTDALPLDGLVWMPQGDGPFPLVLMVHGNHAMGDFSEPGFEYLGRHLASRGSIAVSVDEDFLNGSWAGDWQAAEQPVRAWLLLLHIDQWRTWNTDPASPMHGLVDLDRVALIGHSRGGEAATVAAMVAARDTPPRAGLVPWPTGIRIRAVVAIAPSDEQYGQGVRLEGTDLLAISGGHDGDVRGWAGLRQYARTTVTDGGVKAAFWSYRSNHGQFNTVWGRSDQGPYGGALLDLAPILAAEDQEDVAKTAIGAFLEASLRDHDGYLGLFRRPMVGRAWLPQDIYLVRSLDGSFEPLTDADPSRPLDGIDETAGALASRRVGPLPLRALQPDQGMSGLLLRWEAGAGEASWGLTGLDGRVAAVGATELRLALANGSDPSDARPLDPTIELTTSDGVTVALPLSRWGVLPPPLTVSLTKNDLLRSVAGIDLSVRSPVERVLQTYAIPLSDAATIDPHFQADHLSAFRLRIDRATSGGLWVAEVGLGSGAATP